MKTTIQLILSFMILCVVAVVPTIHAVVPPPDGGYPGGNTAEGQNALLNLTSGGFNTAVGWVSLRSDTTGEFNTAIGAAALFRNNGDENTALGTGALLSNSTGIQNTATGAFALFSNTGPADNPSWPSGIAGSFNTANGDRALFSNTTGAANTAIGGSALFNNTIGSTNTAIGTIALSSNSSGNNNIALGFAAGGAVSTADEVIAIGTLGQNVSNSCFIGQIYSNVQPEVGTDPDRVTINSNGRLGRGNVSSRRYKHDIKPMHNASEAIYALNPVSFRYHKQYDQTQTIAFGLIAEEVAEVCPDLVGRNPKGQPESVRYEQINAMLLNEFLKEHRKVEQLRNEFGATVAQQQKEIRALTGQLKEQAAQIEKVSAQLELSQATPQTVLNNP
jgi:Chaperone of endosialidase